MEEPLEIQGLFLLQLSPVLKLEMTMITFTVEVEDGKYDVYTTSDAGACLITKADFSVRADLRSPHVSHEHVAHLPTFLDVAAEMKAAA